MSPVYYSRTNYYCNGEIQTLRSSKDYTDVIKGNPRLISPPHDRFGLKPLGRDLKIVIPQQPKAVLELQEFGGREGGGHPAR